MSRPALIASLMLVSACSSDAPEPRVRAQGQWHLALQVPEAPGDAVVATVNGSPVHASCVVTQGATHNLDRDQALRECIDFELLAQAAHAANTHTAPDVQRDAKQELVRSFTHQRYNVRGPQDIPEDTVRRLWDQINVPRYNHPELRRVTFCRIPLAQEHGPESEEYKAAQAFLQNIYEDLRDKRDLEKEELYAPCYETYEDAGIPEMLLQFTTLRPAVSIQENFRKVYFAVEEAGMVAPPIHSIYGWDLPLIVEIKPEKVTTFEEAEEELREVLFNMPVYESVRDELFEKWYSEFANARQISVHPERLPSSGPVLSGGPDLGPQGATPP